jgi:hypothetical protein
MKIVLRHPETSPHRKANFVLALRRPSSPKKQFEIGRNFCNARLSDEAIPLLAWWHTCRPFLGFTRQHQQPVVQGSRLLKALTPPYDFLLHGCLLSAFIRSNVSRKRSSCRQQKLTEAILATIIAWHSKCEHHLVRL